MGNEKCQKSGENTAQPPFILPFYRNCLLDLPQLGCALEEQASFNAHKSSVGAGFVQHSAIATAIAALRLALALYCCAQLFLFYQSIYQSNHMMQYNSAKK